MILNDIQENHQEMLHAFDQELQILQCIAQQELHMEELSEEVNWKSLSTIPQFANHLKLQFDRSTTALNHLLDQMILEEEHANTQIELLKKQLQQLEELKGQLHEQHVGNGLDSV